MSAEDAVIPGPPGLPLLGSINEVDTELPLTTYQRWGEIYGDIFQVNFVGKKVIFVGSQAFMNELSDEKRFAKKINLVLEEVRNGIHDGLFTAYGPQEKNWGIAHRILMPAFGPLSIRNMFDDMYDISTQMAIKWARHGNGYRINVSDDFTRLALDTLALCSMNYRFNSYYHDEMHPFVKSMGDFLTESGNRSRRPGFMSMVYRQAEQKYWADIEVLTKTAGDVVKARKSNPNDSKDLLNAMLNGKDPQTGESLSDDSITRNLVTFLIAGHETTSGMLSYTFYFLLKNPQAYQKAQEEIDRVCGRDKITVDHLTKLPYIAAMFRESLRCAANITMIGLAPVEDTTLGGKYKVGKNQSIMAFLGMVHRDPKVWGEDADQWKPERMLDAEFEKRNKEFPNNWKPFGNGIRACIGRPFAWQESLLCVALLLQSFSFSAADPAYVLKHKQTLTIKPKDFYMLAQPRHGVSATDLERSLQSSVPGHTHETSAAAKPADVKPAGNLKKLSVFYGSNTGTCEALAQRLANNAPRHGFQASIVNTLDSAKENIPTEEPVVIVTASYEGQPPDNAAHFVAWLESLKSKELEKVNYAVFGCGHHDWGNTFQRIPTLVDQLIFERGGTRVAPQGKADAAAGDMFSDFENWEDAVFWPAMKEKYGAPEKAATVDFTAALNVEVSAPRSSTLRQDVSEAQVIAHTVLTGPDVPEKRHVEIQLPSGMQYSAGDYLAILPLNPKENVQRAVRHFGLAWDSVLTISATGPSSLPTDQPMPAADLLGAYVELAQPASKRNISELITATEDEPTKEALTKLTSPEAFASEISSRRVSVLDLLERYPSVKLPLSVFLSLLPPMRVRQYSISSSPLWNPSNVTLTYGVLDQPAFSGQGRHFGVASNYLSSLQPGDRLHVNVRQSHQAFSLPLDAAAVPIIMIAAGTGLAPFRGFVQERAALVGAGRKIAPAMLFFGCRSPGKDDIHAAELQRWEAMGAVKVYSAFSKAPEQAEGCKYVQDRLWKERDEVRKLWADGARIYVCGSREVGEGVKEVCIKIRKEGAEKSGETLGDQEAEEWFERIRNDRYATDVFA